MENMFNLYSCANVAVKTRLPVTFHVRLGQAYIKLKSIKSNVFRKKKYFPDCTHQVLEQQ